MTNTLAIYQSYISNIYFKHICRVYIIMADFRRLSIHGGALVAIILLFMIFSPSAYSMQAKGNLHSGSSGPAREGLKEGGVVFW